MELGPDHIPVMRSKAFWCTRFAHHTRRASPRRHLFRLGDPQAGRENARHDVQYGYTEKPWDAQPSNRSWLGQEGEEIGYGHIKMW